MEQFLNRDRFDRSKKDRWTKKHFYLFRQLYFRNYVYLGAEDEPTKPRKKYKIERLLENFMIQYTGHDVI